VDYAGIYTDITIATAEVFLASGQPQRALEWFHSRIVIPPAARASSGEDILAAAAHAAAECAQAARDTRDNQRAHQAIAMLDDLIDRWPATPFTTTRPDAADQAMTKALFDAEVARCRDEPSQAEL